ncbi:MAG TPA: type II secretion system major pseudopilin GspG [Nitrospiria bacterium]|jgi:general secretion pathway protein G
MKQKKLDQSGFTLIEIMVVVVILAVLVALVAPKIVGRTDDARRTAAKVQMRNIEGALQLFKMDNGFYPSTDQGLESLVNKPSVGEIPRNWSEHGYISKIPKDPWGSDYSYLSPGTHGEFDLMSYGADHEQGGEGKNADVENWNIDDAG